MDCVEEIIKFFGNTYKSLVDIGDTKQNFLKKTLDLYEFYINKNPNYLGYIDEELQVDGLCYLALTKDSLTLNCIKNKKQEYCDYAVSLNGYSIIYVPNIYRTDILCKMAVRSYPFVIQYLEKNVELCKLAVSTNGWALKYIPDELLTEELCLTAVNNNGLILQIIPTHLHTKNVCLTAINNNPKSLLYCKKKDEEIYLEAVKKDGLLLYFIDKNKQTVKICNMALQNNINAMEFVKI